VDAALLTDDKEEIQPMLRMTPAAMVARSALFTYLKPRLAQDAKIDWDSLVKGVSSRNYQQKRSGILLSVKTATKGRLAQDADIMDLANLLDALSPAAEQADQMMQTEPNSGPPMAAGPPKEGQDDEKTDVVAKIKAYLQQEGVSPEILQNLDAFLAEEGNPAPSLEGQGGDQALPPVPATSGDENELEDCVSDQEETEEERKRREAEDEVNPSEQSEPVTKTAMDAAIRTAVAKAQQNAIANQRAIRQAERTVRLWVGDLAMDAASPSEVYRTTLKLLGMDAAKVDKLHPDALLPILEAQPKPGIRKAVTRVAADAAPAGSFLERFPLARNITIQ
jgi:hypothetical protein